MISKKILVIGGNGQLGNCLRKISEETHSPHKFYFKSSAEADVSDADAVNAAFRETMPDFCVNASAYTSVDLAETEVDKAFAVNADGVGNLAEACRKFNCTLIHVSTDYVFSGDTEISYSEDSFTAPQGVYGASKLKGEELAMAANPKSIILRTSWLYSEFNKNFVKTMLNLFATKDSLNVVADQFGQPTNANDLAEAILKIIDAPVKKYGIYHFSNYPETSWYHFAQKIADFAESSVKISPITTAEYPTPAKRPRRSTMDLRKIEKDYQIEPKNWQDSLETCIDILKKQ